MGDQDHGGVTKLAYQDFTLGCASGGESTSLTPDGIVAISRDSTSATKTARVCLALGLLLGGSLGFSSASTAVAYPTPGPSVTLAQVVPLVAPTWTGARRLDKRSVLRQLFGSWKGEDFDACLDLVIEARTSVFEHDDVSA